MSPAPDPTLPVLQSPRLRGGNLRDAEHPNVVHLGIAQRRYRAAGVLWDRLAMQFVRQLQRVGGSDLVGYAAWGNDPAGACHLRVARRLVRGGTIYADVLFQRDGTDLTLTVVSYEERLSRWWRGQNRLGHIAALLLCGTILFYSATQGGGSWPLGVAAILPWILIHSPQWRRLEFASRKLAFWFLATARAVLLALAVTPSDLGESWMLTAFAFGAAMLIPGLEFAGEYHRRQWTEEDETASRDLVAKVSGALTEAQRALDLPDSDVVGSGPGAGAHA
jgi:hypothetical protein